MSFTSPSILEAFSPSAGKKEIKVHTIYIYTRTFTFRYCAYDTLARGIIARGVRSCIVAAAAHSGFRVCGFFTTLVALESDSYYSFTHSAVVLRSVSLIRVHRTRFTKEVDWKVALLLLASTNHDVFRKPPLCVAKSTSEHQKSSR